MKESIQVSSFNTIYSLPRYITHHIKQLFETKEELKNVYSKKTMEGINHYNIEVIVTKLTPNKEEV